MLLYHKTIHILISVHYSVDPKGANGTIMDNKSKKRSILTVQKYRKLNNKRQKTAIFLDIGNELNVVSRPPSERCNNARSRNDKQLNQSSLTYYIYPSSKGVDLHIIRNDEHNVHSSKPNIASIMARASQYRFVHIVDKHTKSTPKKQVAKKSYRSYKDKGSITSVPFQTTISSYFPVISRLETNNTTKNIYHPMSILYGKSRCLVEDFVVLPPNRQVVILIPTTDKNKHTKAILRSLKNSLPLFPIVQFGPKSSIKYYIVSGFVKSNPQYIKCIENTLSKSEVMSAFNVHRNNGYGLVIQFNHSDTEYNTSKSMNVNVLVKWIEVLHGRADGVQVWSDIDKQRDFSNNINPNCLLGNDSLSHTRIISYLYEEVACDINAILHLQAKYFMILNKKRRELILKISNCSKSKNVLAPVTISNKYIQINDIIECTFKEAITI